MNRNYRTIALIIASAMFMEQLDATVLATALPTMARDFGVTAPHMSVALTSYLLSLAIFIPASGWVADRYGARTVFGSAILVFTAGSVLCAQAPSLSWLVAARLLQGLGGAMMMPVGRLVLLRSVRREDMVSAMSWLLVPAMMGPVVGPPLGGVIVTYLDWRWIFYINLPIGLLGMALTARYIANIKGDDRTPLDVAGLLLSGVSLGCLFFGLELISRDSSGALTLALLAVGLVAGGFYIRHAARHKAPILQLSLMKVQSFRLSVIAGSLTRITQGAHPFLLPLMLQLGFGLSPAQSGSIVLATALGSVLMKAFAPALLRRYGFRRSLMVNGLISSGGYALCAAFRPDWSFLVIFGILVACGFFMSFQFTGYNTVAYAEIESPQMSAATSFYTTFQQLMLSTGICVAALSLHLSMAMFGHVHPTLADFSSAFLMVTAISAAALVWNRQFDPAVGTDISGHALED
ncbi:MAG TPA: DHA2 family efflux MFS transporter permease subunit [Candidatus Sulfotelmatobacter sp.]|jgi:EmrB/QacA subfamily drug resistance transporter|nr:DHA2 family efflux MFS transporter permease subunit [Candidatus Sulfotelmatobacter sp.]